ncbi:MAG: M1 family aminopeptidase [Calditrichia bacterium]
MLNTCSRYAFIIIALLTIVVSAGFAEDDREVPEDYERLFEQLTSLEIDKEQVADVRNLTLRRDAGTFLLQEGKIAFLKPVDGRIHGAVFIGKGSFRMTPPTKVEREQLSRFTEKEEVNQKLKRVFLFFADKTEEELRNKLDFTKSKLPRKAQSEVDYALKYLWQKKKKRFDYLFLRTLLNDSQNGLFYAHFSERQFDPWFFEINPYEDEEIRFSRRRKGASFLHLREVINQFHKESDYRQEQIIPESHSSMHITHYDIDCTLKGSQLEFAAKTRLDITMLQDEQKWLHVFLYYKLKIDSLIWDSGQHAEFVKEKENALLWIKADSILSRDDSRSLTIYYHGDLIERRKDWFFIQSSKGWYPRHDFQQLSTFDVRYTVPENMSFASFGELASDSLIDKNRITQWTSEQPIRNGSFNVGFFTDHEVLADSTIPISVMMSETGHQEIGRQLASSGVGSGRNMEIEVGEDIANSVSYFRKIYGDLASSRLYATDIPYGHGEAFPGLLHLAWLTFQNTNDAGDDQIFRAHEVAHQWWGIGVDFQTYHDQWLSEGFAEYAGWSYFHNLLLNDEDEKKFYDIVKAWREKIVNNRSFFFGEGMQAAPIWLGPRVQNSETKGDYTLIIYKKGAWVLHMLSSMFMALETASEQRFTDIVRGFFQENIGKRVSTEDFQHWVEAQTGEELDWFFEQWVYGTEIPEYRVASKISETSDGQWLVELQVERCDVSAQFQMPMLVGIEYAKEQIEMKRINIREQMNQFSYIVSEKPKKVLFNHRESVLAKIEKVNWNE